MTPSLSSPSSPALTAAASPFISPATEKGAYDFVKAYFAERDRVRLSGALSGIAPYRVATCSCVTLEKNSAERARQGRKIRSIDHEFTKWYFEWRGPTAAEVFVAVDYDTLYERGSPARLQESGYFVLELKRDFARWMLTDLRLKQTA